MLAGVKSNENLSQRLLRNIAMKIVALHLQLLPEGDPSQFLPIRRSIYIDKTDCKEVWTTKKVDSVGYNISNKKSILIALQIHKITVILREIRIKFGASSFCSS